MRLKINDVVRPTALCMETIHAFKPWHRGIVVNHPDKFDVVNVKWYHKKYAALMAVRYVAIVPVNVFQDS